MVVTESRLPLVLLPGTLCDQRVWARHAVALGRQRAVQVALIGHAPDLRAEAARLLATLPRVFVLAGFSLGAIVALECLRQAPARVIGLCLTAATARADLPANAQMRQAQLRRFSEGDVAGLVAQELLPCYFAGTARISPRARQERVDLIHAMASATPVAHFAHQVRYAIERPDSFATLAQSRTPVLLQCGQADVLCPPQRHEEIAEVCHDVRLLRLGHCGHFVPIEGAASSIIAMQEWLETIDNKYS